MDDFIRPPRRPQVPPQPIQPQPPVQAPPNAQAVRVTTPPASSKPAVPTPYITPVSTEVDSSTPLPVAVDKAEGPEARPALFTKDGQDAPDPTPPSLDDFDQTDELKAAAAAKAVARAKKKQWLIYRYRWALLGVLLLVGLGAGGFFGFKTLTKDARPAQKAATQATVITASAELIEGTVEFKRGGAEWSELAEATDIQAEDQIRTKDSSRAVIAFSDGSVIRMGASARATITDLATDKITITNQAGNIYARVAQSKERTFTIMINDDAITAKGTAFKTFNTIDTTGVEVYHNSVEVADFTIGEGEMYYIASPDASKKGKAMPIDIEALKKDEFILWCLALDKENDTFKEELGFLGDFSGPDLTITAPKDGDVITVSDGTAIGAVNVVGKTEKDAKVTVIVKSAQGEVPSDAQVDAVGGFGTGLLSGPIGKVTYEVVARDPNGNKTIKSVTIEYKLEVKATPTPAVSNGVSAAKITDVSVMADSSIKVTWEVPSGTDVSNGFALVWSKGSQPSPTFPSADSVTAGRDARVTVIPAGKLEAEISYRLRMCIVETGGGCSAYSAEKSVTGPSAPTPTP